MRNPQSRGTLVMTRNYTAVSLKEQKMPTLSLEPRDFDTRVRTKSATRGKNHSLTSSPAREPSRRQDRLLCLPLHPDRVGARPQCRARETSSRASRADITSLTTSIATGNDSPHAKRRPFDVLSLHRKTSPCFSLSVTVSFSTLLCPRSWS